MSASDFSTDQAYVDRLISLQEAKWKRILRVQAPYQWNLLRLKPGKTLEIGAGIGRNLAILPMGSVGVEQSRASVAYLKNKGLLAEHVDEFSQSMLSEKQGFDSLLFSHVAEHMTSADFLICLKSYLPYLKPEGKLIVICPQEVGYASDPTHVEFFDHARIRKVAEAAGFIASREFSFPFPRWVGRFFIYNEFISVFTH